MASPFWTETIPIWVSRKNADGQISEFAVSGWLFMLGWVLLILNFFIWNLIALAVAVKVVF